MGRDEGQTVQVLRQKSYGFHQCHFYDQHEPDSTFKQRLYLSELERTKMASRLKRVQRQVRKILNPVQDSESPFQRPVVVEPEVSEAFNSGDGQLMLKLGSQMELMDRQLKEAVELRTESVFSDLRGGEPDELIREQLARRKTDNIEWLISQFRGDPKIYEFTKAGYSFRPEGYQAYLEKQKNRGKRGSTPKENVESKYSMKNLQRYLVKGDTHEEEMVPQQQPERSAKFDELAETYDVDADDPQQRIMILTLKLLEKSSALDYRRARVSATVKPHQAQRRLDRIRRITHDLYTKYQAPVLVPKPDHLVRTSRRQTQSLDEDTTISKPKEPMRTQIGILD